VAVGWRAADGVAGRPYLALGDSITFGFIANAGFAYVNPDNFIGFPSYVSPGLRLDAVNASCPGETTGSFLAMTVPDNGCRLYRSLVPLHVAYSSTQGDFAVAFLRAHPEVKLVTIGLGANDVLLLQAQCANDFSCVENGLPQVLTTVTTNLATILAELRATGFMAASSDDLLSTVISACYIFGFRKDNPNIFNNLIQNWPYFQCLKCMCH